VEELYRLVYKSMYQYALCIALYSIGDITVIDMFSFGLTTLSNS